MLPYWGLLVAWAAVGLVFVNSVGLQQSPEQEPAHAGVISSEFDRFDEVTTITLDARGETGMTNSRGEEVRVLFVSGAFSFDGETLTRPPDKVSLTFYALTDDVAVGIPSDPRWLIDGRAMRPETTTNDVIVRMGIGLHVCTMTFSARDFSAMADAKVVDGRLWLMEFTLRQTQKNALRELASRMRPS